MTPIPRSDPLIPAYYWAGKGSATVHALKGFDLGVDTAAYERAYDEDHLRWLRDVGGVNFVFLSYNWGLPPEQEVRDWERFAGAARRCHDLGIGVAAYIQPTNAVAIGTYASRDWYARTPAGRSVPFYRGRYFTCLNDDTWRDTVHERVSGAIDAGADAIFLDNCAFGAMPIPLTRDYTGFAGCYCERCHAAFAEWLTGQGLRPARVPAVFRPAKDPVAKHYATWRADVLTGFLADIREHVRRRDPAIPVFTNTVGAVNVNSFNLFGVDLPAIARIVDWLFVENLQSPRAEPGLLVQNAGTFKLLQGLKPGAPTLSISYDRGIGVDGIPPPRTFERTMAEGLAAGGSPVIRIVEYVVDHRWTMLQPGRHDEHLAAAGRVARFVRENPGVFCDRRDATVIAVYVPPGLGWRGDMFPRTTSDYQAVIQALVGAAIPFRVVTALDDLDGVKALLVPAGTVPPPCFAGAIIPFGSIGARRSRRSLFALLVGPVEPLVRRAGPWWIEGYFTKRRVRRFVDRFNLVFRLAFRSQLTPLRLSPGVTARLRSFHPVRVHAGRPVFASLWQTPGELHLHLVNYADDPATVRLSGELGTPSRLIDADGVSVRPSLAFQVRNYAVASWRVPEAGSGDQ